MRSLILLRITYANSRCSEDIHFELKGPIQVVEWLSKHNVAIKPLMSCFRYAPVQTLKKQHKKTDTFQVPVSYFA